jgi:hypothetical protein
MYGRRRGVLTASRMRTAFHRLLQAADSVKAGNGVNGGWVVPIWIPFNAGRAHNWELPVASSRHSSVSRTRLTITAGSSMANVTVRSNPFPPVMSTQNQPLNGSAAIHPSYGALACLQPATTRRSQVCAFGPDYVSFEVNSLSPLTSVRRMSRPW